ncbi:uncharacterized protein LOC134750483 [Cydia strobilella]|uniref:uncharacterized protein LOC134750483 n=1 Tax=Cydia strobilella TaxID=1100964 RepID=UPI00300794BB
MQCSICKSEYHDFKTYFVHLNYYHNISDYFKCPFENCERVYHTKSSLKKHICGYHGVQNENNVCMTEIQEKKSDSVTSINHITTDEPTEPTYFPSVSDTISHNNYSNESSPSSNFEVELNKLLLSFVSQLYSISSLPRTVIQTIVQLVTGIFTSEPILILKKALSSISEECSSMLSLLQNSFKNLGTDYKRIECLKKLRTYTKPVPKTVGVSEDTKSVHGSVEMTLINRCSYMVPLRESLKSFLEVPNVLDDILNYEKAICKDNVTLRNLVNGNCWQDLRKQCKDENILPLTIYYDDFESGNPLGSHAGNQKIGVVYATISTIPPKFSSRLENILLAHVFYTADKTMFGNEAIFGPLIEELKFLEREGILIFSKGHSTVVKFCLANMSGDNLGLHSILGLHESFSSNNFCRFCITSKHLTKTDTKERLENIRKTTEYEKHCQDKIGIKEECVWHQLNFHTYKNLTCDVMHDLCEGVHRYDMSIIIKQLLDSNYFSLKTLNARIKFFTYLRTEKNCPPSVTKQHLLNGQLIFSASEMLCLVRNFRFIVGDLVKDVNDQTWLHYLRLLEITDILTSQVFTPELLGYLTNLIESYLENLQSKFHCTLKPKHHFLLHYPRVIEQIGPPILVSAFKFESKHKELKAVAQSISCRKNLPLTLATRHQLKTSYRLIVQDSFSDSITCGKIIHVQHYPSELNEAEYICVEYYENNGVKYNDKNVILYKYDINFPLFYKIDRIFVKESDHTTVSFLCKELETVGYSSHYMAFVVEITTKSRLVTLGDCDCKTPTLIRKLNECFYVDLKS